jgi:hypothetical protein
MPQVVPLRLIVKLLGFQQLQKARCLLSRRLIRQE